jgi:hypothetical protein
LHKSPALPRICEGGQGIYLRGGKKKIKGGNKMKIKKEIIEGEVKVSCTLSADEEKALAGVWVSIGPCSGTLKDSNFPVGNFAYLRDASYAGKRIDLPQGLIISGKVDKKPETLLEQAMANYDAIIAVIKEVNATCGEAEIMSKKSAFDFLAGENRLFYLNAKGQMQKID